MGLVTVSADLRFSTPILDAQNGTPNPTPPKHKYYEKLKKILFQISKTQKIPSETLLLLFFSALLYIYRSKQTCCRAEPFGAQKNPNPNSKTRRRRRNLERLETQVKQIAKKILEYRATLPDQLKTTVASLPSSQRPILPDCDSGTDPGPPGELNPDSGQDKSSRAAFLTKEDQETAEKAHLLIEKISGNVSTVPVVLKRMRDCISRTSKLDAYIHPAFKKKKTS